MKSNDIEKFVDTTPYSMHKKKPVYEEILKYERYELVLIQENKFPDVLDKNKLYIRVQDEDLLYAVITPTEKRVTDERLLGINIELKKVILEELQQNKLKILEITSKKNHTCYDYESDWDLVPLETKRNLRFSFLRAIEENRLPWIERCLEIFPQILNTPHPYYPEKFLKDFIKDSPVDKSFLRAAGDGYIEIVKLLLEKGAKINKADKKKKTPLLLAAANGYIEIVKLLLEKGAKVNKADIYNNTSLLLAAANGHFEIVKLLLEKGAKVNKADIYSNTPLLLAAANGYVEIVKLLLEKGANINTIDIDTNTPLLLAAANGYVEIVKLLLEKGANVNTADVDKNTPLLRAAAYGHFEIVKLLLEKGANVNTTDINKNTPLLLAAAYGHFEIVKLLLEEKGANVNQPDIDDYTPLLRAAAYGHFEIVKLLLEKGANINQADINNSTALLLAAANGYVEIVKVLLEKGANVNITDVDNSTPLLLAAANGYVEIVKLLLEKGANVNTADINNNTPLLQAENNSHFKIVKLIKKFPKQKPLSENIGLFSNPHDNNNNVLSEKLVFQSAVHLQEVLKKNNVIFKEEYLKNFLSEFEEEDDGGVSLLSIICEKPPVKVPFIIKEALTKIKNGNGRWVNPKDIPNSKTKTEISGPQK